MTPTPPQEQTEREAFEAWIRTQPRHEGANLRFLALNNAYIDFDVHGSWQAWQARASMRAQAPEVAALQREVAATYNQWCGRDYMHLPLSEAVGAVIGALQREVEELRELLIDTRDGLCDIETLHAQYLRDRIDAAVTSKAEVPNGGSLA